MTKLKLMRKPGNSKKKRQTGISRKLNLPEFKRKRMLKNFGFRLNKCVKTKRKLRK